jgi:hypothetical protein
MLEVAGVGERLCRNFNQARVPPLREPTCSQEVNTEEKIGPLRSG